MDTVNCSTGEAWSSEELQTAAAVILQHAVSVTNTETVFMSTEFVDHSHVNTVTQ